MGRSSEGMTLDEVKAHIRRKWKWYEKPKKSDRLFLTDTHWLQMDWTEREKEINIALPYKLWNMRHDDYIWPLAFMYRGTNAHGFRAGEEHRKYAPIIPRLVRGRGIARWMASNDTSVAFIPELADYEKVWTPENMPGVIRFRECKVGNPEHGAEITMPKDHFLKIYAPSPLQKFSRRSWLLTSPWHFSAHRIITQREGTSGGYANGRDRVLFFRTGARWDSYDEYYTVGAFYLGLSWN